MKKILLISGSLPPIRCGVGYYTERLSHELSKQKLDFELLSTEGVDKNTPVPLLTVPNWKIWSLPKMLAAIRHSGAEIIHIEYPAVGYRRQLGINLLPYALRIYRRKLKIIVTLHEYHGSRPIGRARDFITVVPAHKIIISNQADRLSLPKWLARKAELIPIASNLVKVAKDPQIYTSELRKNKLDSHKPTLLFFGFAFPAKGLGTLLKAMSEPYLADWQLLLLTDLDKKNAYHRTLIEKIELLNQPGARITATGFLPDEKVSAILQEGKYFVLPQPAPISAKSGTAIAAVQHNLVLISCGLNQPELTAPFRHLENCYLLDGMSSERISDAVKQLESSPAKRQKIFGGTRALEDYFSWPHIVAEHLRTYEKL